METIKSLIQKRNEIEARIMELQQDLVHEHFRQFFIEVLNLINGVGCGFVTGDYYAPNRYYSQIPGIKNIRIYDNEIVVKLLSPSGKLIPNKVITNGVAYTVKFVYSSNYDPIVDYQLYDVN